MALTISLQTHCSRTPAEVRCAITSVNDLARKIRRYIKAYSANAKPIHWKYSDPTRRVRSNEITATVH